MTGYQRRPADSVTDNAGPAGEAAGAFGNRRSSGCRYRASCSGAAFPESQDRRSTVPSGELAGLCGTCPPFAAVLAASPCVALSVVALSFEAPPFAGRLPFDAIEPSKPPFECDDAACE